MVGWYHRLDGHESEQTLGDGEGQGSLVCCSPWGRKQWDMTEQLNNKPQEELPSVPRKLAVHLPASGTDLTASMFISVLLPTLLLLPYH